MTIKPAVIPKRVEDIAKIAELAKDRFPIVHIDMCDGMYVPSTSWPFNAGGIEELDQYGDNGEGLPHWQDLEYEVDLMVSEPLPLMEAWIRAGASSFVVHAEGLEENVFHKLLETAHGAEAKLIFAFNPGTDIESVAFAKDADGIQCMGIAKIGFQGNPFDERVIDQIKKVKTLFPDKLVQVDGAVSKEKEEILLEAGADTFVVGSAIESFL